MTPSPRAPVQPPLPVVALPAAPVAAAACPKEGFGGPTAATVGAEVVAESEEGPPEPRAPVPPATSRPSRRCRRRCGRPFSLSLYASIPRSLRRPRPPYLAPRRPSRDADAPWTRAPTLPAPGEIEETRARH